VTEDLVATGVRSMIWSFLRKAVSREEVAMKADRSGTIVSDLLISQAQAYVPKQDQPVE
jgi:hypothetical protein